MTKAIETTQNEEIKDALSSVIASLERQAEAYEAAGKYWCREGENEVGKKISRISKTISKANKAFLEEWQGIGRSALPLRAFHTPLAGKTKAKTVSQQFQGLAVNFSTAAKSYKDAGDIKMSALMRSVAGSMRSASAALDAMHARDKQELAVFKGSRPHFSSHCHSGSPRHKAIERSDDEVFEPAPDSLQAWDHKNREGLASEIKTKRRKTLQQMLVTAQ